VVVGEHRNENSMWLSNVKRIWDLMPRERAAILQVEIGTGLRA